jgi:hypothetical protein
MSTVVGTHERPRDQAVVMRAIALLSEGLLSEAEFTALTGIQVPDLMIQLADPLVLAGVQRAAIELRESGVIARLEAARHAREAVRIAADIMRDPDVHPTARLNAATFVAKVSGTERPASDSRDAQERHSIVINIGEGRPAIVISGRTVPSQTDGSRD